MKTGFIKLLGSLVLTAFCAVMISCDVPEEKKSLFQRAASAESDSNSSQKHHSDQEVKKEDKKKPKAFTKIDRVTI